MKSKSKGSKKTVPNKNASLKHVITQNEKIKETVKQGKDVKIPVQIIKEAIIQNKSNFRGLRV